MEYLIDTQILLWFQSDDADLDQSIRDIIIDPKNQIYVSHPSLYEVAIKLRINKLPNFHVSVQSIVNVGIQDKIKFLPIAISHLTCYQEIPFFPDHRDPFDRLIIAVGFAESLPIITSDPKFKFYESIVTIISA